jgi:hypothetical protein
MWQACLQIRHLLRALTWAGGAPVLGSVHVAALAGPEALSRMRLPAALILPAGGEAKEGTWTRRTATVRVSLIQRVPGDWSGEAALVGGARAGGALASSGRGLLEVEARVVEALGVLAADASGFGLGGVGWVSSDAARVPVAGDAAVVTVDLEWSAEVGVAPAYPGAIYLQRTGDALRWQLPPRRYDAGSVVLRRSGTTTPPATVADGTGVTLSGDWAETVTDATAAPRSWSLFVRYDEPWGAVYSDPVSLVDAGA